MEILAGIAIAVGVVMVILIILLVLGMLWSIITGGWL